MATAGRLIPVPNLDDRNWATIKNEMLAYIRDKAASDLTEWTDLNPSDPGVTLVESFARGFEKVIVRGNAILPKHFREYLNLIGITLTPASAASVHCFFKTPAKPTVDVTIPSAFEIATERIGDAPPVVFSTDAPLVIEKAEVKKFFADDGGSFTDFTSEATNPGDTFDPLPSVAVDDAIYIAYAEDNYFEKLTVDLEVAMADVTGVWEYYEIDVQGQGSWKTLTVIDGTSDFTVDGDITFSIPALWSPTTVNGFTGTWIRFRVTALAGSPDFAEFRSFDIDEIRGRAACSNAVQVADEILGSGNGAADQYFYLQQVPILDATVLVDEGGGFEEWAEVDDLAGSSAVDKHYVLNHGTGEVLFGDGIRGKAPAIGTSNIKAAPYRYGGGAAGIVGENTIVSQRDTHAWIATVTNLSASSGGADEETIVQALERGPTEALKTRNRGVADEDFETLVLAGVPGISRVKTLPLFDPATPATPKAGVISVVLVATGGVTLSATLRDQVRDYLDARRLTTAQLYVFEAETTTVDYDVTVVKTADVTESTLEDRIEAVIDEYYDREFGGDAAKAVAFVMGTSTVRGTGWEFGRDIYRSELFELLERIPGVDHTDSITTPASTATIESYKLPAVGTVTVTVS